MNRTTTALSLLAALLLGGCATTDKAPEAAAPAGPNVVTYTAVEYGYQGPAEIPSGPTTFKLVSTGKEIHHLTIVKLEEGKTYDSLLVAMKNPGPPPAWMVMVGGPNAPSPGGESNATMNIEPGNYALLCFVEGPDKVMHFMKGMSRGLTVTASTAPTPAPIPAPTITMTASEYKFELDKPLTAGKHIIKLVNTGNEPHEVEIIKMEPGKTIADLGAWFVKMEGPPPGAPIGGIAPTVKGKDGQFEIDITPGSYIIMCFLPAPDKKPHFEHGMLQQIEVQ